MSNVVQLSPAAPPAPSDHDLLTQTISIVTALTSHTIALERHAADQSARIAVLESRLPPPRFEVPEGWLVVKQASGRCGYSAPTLYRWVRLGRIVGAPFGGNIYIDPSTLPAKVLGVSKTTEIK
jgi:hypothetical protein